jgi:hypothetical protein
MDRVDKTIRKYARIAALDEIKAEAYRYWQNRPAHERIAAVSELTQQQYAMRGEAPNPPRLEKTLVRIERSNRKGGA